MLGYTSWHQLFVYSCISRLLSADLFMLLLFSYLLFSTLDLLLFCTHCLYARAFPLFLCTHYVTYWRPWIRASRTGCFTLLIRCLMRLACYKKLEFLSIYSGIIVFLFIPVDSVIFLILYTLLSVVILFLYSCDIMCGHSYVVLQWYW